MNDVVLSKEFLAELIRIAEGDYYSKTAFHKGYQSAVMDLLYSVKVSFKEPTND